jgi:hypothetical protein
MLFKRQWFGQAREIETPPARRRAAAHRRAERWDCCAGCAASRARREISEGAADTRRFRASGREVRGPWAGRTVTDRADERLIFWPSASWSPGVQDDGQLRVGHALSQPVAELAEVIRQLEHKRGQPGLQRQPVHQ